MSGAGEKEDWWEELTQSQKNSLLASEQQYKSGEVISNDEVLKKIQQWLQK